MKVEITFKDPDGVHESIGIAVDSWADELPDSLSEEEIDALRELRTEKVTHELGRWLSHGEYVTISFDLDTQTARVVP